MPSKKQLLNEPQPRRFQMVRRDDVSGMSGTGIVAEGIEWRDGRCAYRWLTSPGTTQIASQVEDIRHIHGHNGKTTIRWLDDQGHPGEEKTLSQVYEDRNRLAVAFATLCREINSLTNSNGVTGRLLGYDGGWNRPPKADDADAEEWAIVWASTPAGLVSWHVPIAMARTTDLPAKARSYDGHDRDQKNARLLDLARTDE